MTRKERDDDEGSGWRKCPYSNAAVTEVIGRAEAAMTTENRMRSAILDGMDPQEAYLTFGKFRGQLRKQAFQSI